jgi:hypothetical protein
MKFKYQAKKPTRDQLAGLSPSQFKTLLKLRGYKVSRDFFKFAAVAYKNGRAYRFRYWSPEFLVDMSCPLDQFDRWANSVDVTTNFVNWIES